jgi:hypothetical protein
LCAAVALFIPCEAHASRRGIDVECPRRTCKRPQRLAQRQWSQLKMNGRQRQGIEDASGRVRLAESVASPLQDDVECVADRGFDCSRQRDIDDLLE